MTAEKAGAQQNPVVNYPKLYNDRCATLRRVIAAPGPAGALPCTRVPFDPSPLRYITAKFRGGARPTAQCRRAPSPAAPRYEGPLASKLMQHSLNHEKLVDCKSGREIDASQAERLERLSIACFALSLARSAQAERDNESCFFVHVAGVHRFRKTISRQKCLAIRLRTIDSPLRWPSEREASQGAVGSGKSKAAALTTAKNNLSDEADVTAPPGPAPHDPKLHLFLRGVPKELPVDEVKEDLLSQHLPVQSVRRKLNRFRERLDLVLISGTAEVNDKTTKAAFFKIRSVCSLSGVKGEQPRKRALPGQCHNFQSYGHSSRHCFHSARCVKCPGDHGTAQCTRNKDTDSPPACVLCKQKGYMANYLGCPRSKKSPPAREGCAAPSAHARVLVHVKLCPSSDRNAQRPARREK
ncbi:hypothetical protein EVAR_80058_1 [Eumeta japonica]|uniref:Pre-C2HC domain-containing protein n=1 Tax=Eumeta variegata TaxID=151549 RepID=A0A4C1WLS1_EUMVA|nr:hypothetical protein EVAR_80058_1 [Eumeta japonica]